MSQAVISELNIFPVKSLQGIALQQAELTEQGIKWDRFWMIVNEDGQFATQRHLAHMAQIKTAINEDALILSHPDFTSLSIPLSYQGSDRRQAKVWNSECQVFDEGEQARAWLTEVLGSWRGQQLSLVRMATDFSREVSENHTEGAANTTFFADGYPYLVCNTQSLAVLNQKLLAQEQQAVPMSRFRGNIILTTDHAFIEHQSKYLIFAEQQALHLCKPCQRCKVTGIDQNTGVVESSKQPLATLLNMDHVEQKGAFFGQNAVISEHSKDKLPMQIQVGDTVRFSN